MTGTRADDTLPAAPSHVTPEQLPAAGTQIGRYTVGPKVGAGGMGIVYRAHDPSLHRDVAIKLVRPARMRGKGGAAHRARLLREARAMAQLQHPNVIRVYDVGEFGEALFVAMEFVKGYDAAKWLEVEGPGWARVVAVFRAAGRGLAAAHTAGLVHRDFKPANILVGDDYRVRVLDFGLARTAEEIRGRPIGSDDAPNPTWCEDVTSDGVVVGTPAYMAPEQLAGLPADARSDQYAYCLSLWESLFGRLPFRGVTARELAEAKTRDALELPPADTDVPEALVEILTKGLASDPQRRFAAMPDILRALRGIAEQAETGVVAPAVQQTPRIRALPWVAFALAAAVAASLWSRVDTDACDATAAANELRQGYRDAIANGDTTAARTAAASLRDHWLDQQCEPLTREWAGLAAP